MPAESPPWPPGCDPARPTDSETSALARSDPGLLAKSDPPNRPETARLPQGNGPAGRARPTQCSAYLRDTRDLRASGADDIAWLISCPLARGVLRVGHSIGAQVGHFS